MTLEFDLPLDEFLAELSRLPPGSDSLVCVTAHRIVRFQYGNGAVISRGEAAAVHASRSRLTLEFVRDFRPLFTAAAGFAVALIAFLRPGLPFAAVASALGLIIGALMLVAWFSQHRRQQERIRILLGRHTLRPASGSPVLGLN